MKFANFLTKTKEFLIKRITELFGLLILLSSLIIMVSLISYSPNDPNFINNEFNEIENLLGFRGSVLSDFLFQSVGLIAYLIPFTLFFSGTNILINKRQLIFIDNLFYSVLYIIFGCLFFSNFNNESFFLTINGNGGFIGLFLKNTFLGGLLNLKEYVSYYFLIIFTSFLFLISINFRVTQTLNYIRMIKKIFYFKKELEVNNNNINENNFSQNLTDNKRVQESLPFESKLDKTLKKFILPDIKLLKLPSRNEKLPKKMKILMKIF